jgi:hypothetical protein
MGNKASDRRLNESPTREQRPKNVDRLREGMHQTANAGSAFQKENSKTAEFRSEPNDFKKIGSPKYFSSLIRQDPRKKSEITLYACLRS